MHDLHAADQILKTALKQAQENNLQKITKLKIELGEILEHGKILSAENLRFNLALLSKNTLAHNAEIQIEKTRGDHYMLKAIEGINRR